MKKFLLTAVPPILGVIISTQGGLVVNEVHAEKFDPSETYVVENLAPIKTHNRLDTLNKNQTILNINKKDKATGIIKQLKLNKSDRDKYIKMLDTAINEHEINNIVESALKSSNKNESKSANEDNEKKRELEKQRKDTENVLNDLDKELNNENDKKNNVASISSESETGFVYHNEQQYTPPIEYTAPSPITKQEETKVVTGPEKDDVQNQAPIIKDTTEQVESPVPQNNFEIVDDSNGNNESTDSSTESYISPGFEIVEVSDLEITDVVDSAQYTEEIAEEITE